LPLAARGVRPLPPPRPHTDPPDTRPTRRTSPMDIEQINAIGTALTDLSERTEALRGYL
jgi:hypothetical protein